MRAGKADGGRGRYKIASSNGNHVVKYIVDVDGSCISAVLRDIFREVKGMKRFLQDESGMGVVEVILIIVVLIGLVIIFQTQIEKIVNNIFKTITSKTGKVK